jgi:CBS domain-containing protein
MATRYSVVQYVPDPVTGERLNVGVVGFSNGAVKTRFLVNWQRVRTFFGKEALDLDHLEAIFRDVDQAHLLEMIETWHNSIQFTTPNASLRSLEEAIDEAAHRFLIDPPLAVKERRLHADVLSLAHNRLSASISKLVGATTARDIVRRNVRLVGRENIKRRFDLVVSRYKPVHAIQALSFSALKGVEQNTLATAFLAEEIRGTIPFTVVVAPPITPDSEYRNAIATLQNHGAAVVDEDEFPETANSIASEWLSAG